MFDPKIGLILMFDFDLGLIPTKKKFLQQDPGLALYRAFIP